MSKEKNIRQEWKRVTVSCVGLDSRVYYRVAGVRAERDFVVIRQGSFPDEKITKVNKKFIIQYEEAHYV